MSNNILFLGINASWSHSMLSGQYLRSYTESKFPEATWHHFETTINADLLSTVGHILAVNPTHLVATCYLFNREYLLAVLGRVKILLPEVKIHLGGPEFLGNNQEFLKTHREVNGVFRGDETTYYLILKETAKEDIPGLCYLQNDQYKDNGFASFTSELDLLPSPFAQGLFDATRPFLQIETSRGCVGKCSFCTSSMEQTLRCFSLERIEADLTILQASGVKFIRVIDRSFNSPQERSLRLLQLFRDQFSDIQFHLEIHPALLTDTLLNEFKLSRKGQFHIEVGIQSCQPKILKAINRSTAVEKQLHGLHRLIAVDFADIHTDLIAGLPSQTFDDVLQDVKQLLDLAPAEIQLESLKILAGTPIVDNLPEGYSYSPTPPYEVMQTGTLSFAEMEKLRSLSILLDLYYNKPELQNLFLFLHGRHGEFLIDFLKIIHTNIATQRRSSLKHRFEQLVDFVSQYDQTSQEVCRFFCLMNGIGSRVEGVVFRGVPQELEEGKIIWNNPNVGRAKRRIEEIFTCNAADVWLNPKVEIEEDEYRYQILLESGHKIHSIVLLI